jgi:putative permease
MSKALTRGERAIVLERRVKLAFFLTCIVFLFLVVTLVPNMLVSFLLALVIYFLLAPSVDFMERKGINRIGATLLPFLISAVALSITICLFFPDLLQQANALRENSQRYEETAAKLLFHLEEQVGGFINSIFQINVHNKVTPAVYAWASAFLQQLPAWISSSFTVLVLTPFFAFFMLLNGREFVRNLVAMVPNNFFELILNLNFQISSQIGGFIRARLVESLIVGFLIWLGLTIVSFPYAIVLALFASLLNIIPYLGPIIGAAPAFIISLANGGSTSEILALLAVYGAVQVIDTVVLIPFLVAKIVNLHPVTVVLSIIVGSQLMGILGMIICIPVVSVLKVTSIALYKHFTDFRS